VHLKDALIGDQLACLRVEVALVSFSDTPHVEVDFVPPDQFFPPPLTAEGTTNLGLALNTGLDLLKKRLESYRSAGLACYKPWLVLITDAKASDDVGEAARRVQQAEAERRLSFFGIGVVTADMDKLAAISSTRVPLLLDNLRFTDLFQWLSVNLSSVAVSQLGAQVPLTPPTWSTT
jgi:uncharacterized protein YegL